MNNFARVLEANRHFSLFDLSSPRVRKFGRSANDIDFTEAVGYMRKNSKIPNEGHDYRTSFKPLEEMKLKEEASRLCYGHMDIQIGYCNGKNIMLDGLEYHKGTEICVAVTDTVLFLGSLVDMDGITFDSKNVEALYLAEGEAFEMFPTTLHFCPCHTTRESPGFKTIVLLPRGTNEEVQGMKALPSGEGRLLWRRNEWQFVHAEYTKGIAQGNHPGLIGENFRLNVI